jgi:hypothetical protein
MSTLTTVRNRRPYRTGLDADLTVNGVAVLDEIDRDLIDEDYFGPEADAADNHGEGR